MDDVETSVVALTVSDNTNTTHVTTTGDHADNTSVEADEVGDLASGKVNLHGVVDTDGGVGVADAVYIISTTCSQTVFSLLKSQQRDPLWNVQVRMSSADQPKLGPTTE